METIHREGICPVCESQEIEYFNSGREGDEYYYEFICNECESISKEYYSMIYDITILQQKGEIKC